jgi:hypothetical protein
LKKTVSIDWVVPIVWGTLWSNSSSIVTQVPVGGLTHIIQDSLPVQKLNELHFSAAVRAVRSIGACRALSAFWSSESKWGTHHQWRNLRPSTSVKWSNTAAAGVCVASAMHRTGARTSPRVHSEFKAEPWNRRSASPFCVFDMLASHEELPDRITHLRVTEGIIIL